MLDLKSLDAALAHLPYWGTRKFIAKNSSTGRNEWRALDSNDIPTLTSSKISDFTEAAQDAVGAMAASSSKVSLTYVDGTPSLTADIVAGSLGPADIANRVRYISLIIDTDSVTMAYDAHGSLGSVGHVDVTDGAAVTIYFLPIELPEDFVSFNSMIVSISSTVGGNNIVMAAYVEATPDNDATASDVVMSTGDVAYAANATANKTKSVTIAATANPTSGLSFLHAFLTINKASASDSNTGNAAFWGAKLSYNADS